MAQILKEALDLEQVRKALDANLSEDDLPNSTIQLPFYLDVGEAQVIERAPGWADLTGADKVYLKAATVAQVAAILAPAMPGILPKTEEAITYKITRETVDWEKRAGALKTQAATLLGMISTAQPVMIPTGMVLSGPTRASRTTK